MSNKKKKKKKKLKRKIFRKEFIIKRPLLLDEFNFMQWCSYIWANSFIQNSGKFYGHQVKQIYIIKAKIIILSVKMFLIL